MDGFHILVLDLKFLDEDDQEQEEKCPVNNSQGEVGCSRQREGSLQSSEQQQHQHRVALMFNLLIIPSITTHPTKLGTLSLPDDGPLQPIPGLAEHL